MNLQEHIKKILREERKLSSSIIRRLDMLDYEVKKNMKGPLTGSSICIFFKSDIEYFESIMENSIDYMYYKHFSHIDDGSGEWAHTYLDMVDYIRKKYKNKIMKNYDDNCGSRLIPLKESIRRVLREEKLHATPQELIKNLPNELKELLFKQWDAKQNPEWHPEGNTLKHIIVVIKRAYHHYPDDPNMVMAALFHDLGKIDTYKINPKTNQPTAYGHEDKSTDYVEKFKDWIESFEGMDVEEIKYLVKNHMKVKPSTWDQMKDKKKEPIMSHPSFDKLMGFTDKLDGGGTDLKESIRKVLKEEDQRQRYLKSTDSLRKVITLFLNNYIEDGDRKIGKKSRNYGNLREDWCVNGKEVITAIYYYEDDKFYSGSLMVTKKLIEKIMKIFNVRKNFLMSVVEEWYEDTMIPKFEQIVGETGFYFDDVDLFDRDHDCIPEPVKPEDITDEEMLEFIVDNTAYRRDEVINKIESGERDLEDFYLDIVHTVENKVRY